MSFDSGSRTVLAAVTSTSAASGSLSSGPNLKVVGILLAICSGLLIGSSFVFKKKGLLRSQAGQVAGEGVAYLKSPLWWLGMTMMILGELCNFAAYAFVEAIVVTPLGALSVVVCAILSSFFLKEALTFFGWLGCGLCIIGSVIIALNGPQEATVGLITEFQKLFLAPGFLAYIGVLITASIVIIVYFAPRYGTKSMLWYIFVCSMIGGISVSVTTGLGAAIVTTAQGNNQFKHWFLYFLLGFVVITLVTEVYYLNKALALFNTAMVTPTYYVIFTFFSIVTTVVLFQGLKSSATQIITLVMGFLVICFGITILQMSKVDPIHLQKLDRRSTILLQAARSQTETLEEKGVLGVEDPGIDTLRGSFGTVGSIIRARSARRLSQSSNVSGFRPRPSGAAAPFDAAAGAAWLSGLQSPNHNVSTMDKLQGVKRHQLYDAPVPTLPPPPGSPGIAKGNDDASLLSTPSVTSSGVLNKRPTIKFGDQDVVHQYHQPGAVKGERTDSNAIHEHRQALGRPGVVMSGQPAASGYPPPPPIRMRTQTEPNMSANSSAKSAQLIDLQESPFDAPPAPPLGGGTRQQTVSLPSAFSNEHEVHSAPPTVQQPRFGKPTAPRIDSRNIFADSPSRSLPSATDSTGSWSPEDPRSSDRRGRTSTKRYPKGDGDDDREESISLWQRKDDANSDSEVGSPVTERGGIRLVRPKTP